MKIGIFGGTFDPVHIGHLIVADQAASDLRLDRVVFLPAGRPWFKSNRLITDGKDRLQMLKLAVRGNSRFDVSEIELNRSGPTYSVESIPLLKQQYDGAEIYFLLGKDALADIHKWQQPDKIIQMCHVVGLSRPGYESIDWDTIDRIIPGASQKIRLLQVPLIGVSSSDIRTMVAGGKSIRFLIPDDVLDYIERNALYRQNQQ